MLRVVDPDPVAMALPPEVAVELATDEAAGSDSSPTNSFEAFAERASPVCTSEFVEWLVASIEEAPADTAPMTWPATPSPVEAGADWETVARLSPVWVLVAEARAEPTAVE